MLEEERRIKMCREIFSVTLERGKGLRGRWNETWHKEWLCSKMCLNHRLWSGFGVCNIVVNNGTLFSVNILYK